MDYNIQKRSSSPVVVVPRDIVRVMSGSRNSTPVKARLAVGVVPIIEHAAAEPSRVAVDDGVKAGSAVKGKKYDDGMIEGMLSEGYINVPRTLWDHVPNGSHMRYVRVDKGEGLPRSDRFRPGGFLRNHFNHATGKKMIMLETKPGGNKGQQGYVTFPVAYEDIEELWKKYDRFAFVEIHLINSSLQQKKNQIKLLEERVAKLEAPKNGPR